MGTSIIMVPETNKRINPMIRVYRNLQLCNGLTTCGDCTQCIQGLVDGVVVDTEDDNMMEMLDCAINICPVDAVTLDRV